MSSDPVMTMPLQGVMINDLLNVYVSINNQVKQAELDHFIASGKNVPNDFMEIGLKGAIMRQFV
jgi:hypothetical protein